MKSFIQEISKYQPTSSRIKNHQPTSINNLTTPRTSNYSGINMTSRQINNSSRDIKRRPDLITKKVNELKVLGVPIAVAFSTKKTNGLYLIGDPRITQVIDKYKDEILMNPDWMDDDNGIAYTSTVLLPPLPAQLSMLNGLTMKNFIRGLMKDLQLTWASQKPVWWPADIPYQNINHAPSDFQGKCATYLVTKHSLLFIINR